MMYIHTNVVETLKFKEWTNATLPICFASASAN